MKTNILAVAAAIALCVISGSAVAENGHGYHGSYCKPAWGSQAGEFNYSTNGIQNLSGGTRYITCPILQDELANTTGTTQVWLRWDGAGTLTCTMHSKSFTGNTLQSQTAVDANGGTVQIPNITTDHFYGTYMIVCSLPSYGILRTLWIGEQS